MPETNNFKVSRFHCLSLQNQNKCVKLKFAMKETQKKSNYKEFFKRNAKKRKEISKRKKIIKKSVEIR